MNKWSTFLGYVLLVLCVCTYASDKKIIGNLKRVVDGDTIHLKTETNNAIKVRLAFIDAPELNQPFGKDAKAFLKKNRRPKGINPCEKQRSLWEACCGSFPPEY